MGVPSNQPHQLLHGWWQCNEASNIWGSSSACCLCASNCGYLVHNCPLGPFTNCKCKESSDSTVNSRRANRDHQRTRIPSQWGTDPTGRLRVHLLIWVSKERILVWVSKEQVRVAIISSNSWCFHSFVGACIGGMASSHKAMDGCRSTDRACFERLASEMVYWSDEDYNRKFTQSETGNIWGVWTVSLRTLCPFAHAHGPPSLTLHLAWVVMSTGFLKHTPMLIEAWHASSKQSVRRPERAEQARMGHQRHVVQFHAVGQSWAWVRRVYNSYSNRWILHSLLFFLLYSNYQW